jgi:hypothetical protein
VQRIRHERARNNYLVNAEKEYREAKELSERYENKDKAFKDNTPILEHCETLRTLTIKDKEGEETATETATIDIKGIKEKT